jgi:hypothetical protein
MSRLRLLNLSRNQLEGQIPTSLNRISTLEQLDLAKINLGGPIPEGLSTLSMLDSFDVSSNNLCGPIPTGTQFSNFNVTCFEKNECLCGFPLPPCKQKDKPNKASTGDNGDRSNVKRGWLSYVDEEVSLTALTLGLGIGFGGFVAMFIAWDKARCWLMD